MLRLPRFEVLTPTTVADAVAALAAPGARILAGGTDLLPNLKHRLEAPTTLVSLQRVQGLHALEVVSGALRIGASVTLATVHRSELVQTQAPIVSEAAGLVAGPQIRNTATLGGNVNLDTRCRYVNQSEFWRGAIGGCLKSEGDVCHVVKGGRRCVAAMSSDCVPALISLDAEAVLEGPEGTRTLLLDKYFRADGVQHTFRGPGEILTEVRVPVSDTPRRTRYVKWRVRGSIDFPLVSVALRFDMDGDRVADARVVVGVLGAKPKTLARLDVVHGKALSDPEVAAEVSEQARVQCKALDNVPYEADYRRKLLPILIRRAVADLGAACGKAP